MAYNRIETPGAFSGDEQQQLEQVYRYLVRLADDLNIQLESIGGNELTDSERQVMLQILKGAAEQNIPEDALQQELYSMESLKSLIIKTATFVQNKLDEFRTTLIGDSVSMGQFGKYVRHTALDVAVNPEGITQSYSFEEVVQGLKNYTINAKNYIKTGLLRTVNSIPVYGVAIGKDVVTFSNEGVETYNDGNKVAELTADELSFYQGGNKMASYTGSKISFLQGGSEVMYIQNGKIYCVTDLEITAGNKLKVAAGGLIDINATGNLKLEGSTVEIKSGSTFDVDSNNLVIDSDNGYLYTSTGSKILAFGAVPWTTLSNASFISQMVPTDTYGGYHPTYCQIQWYIYDRKTEPGYEYQTDFSIGMFYINNEFTGDNDVLVSGIEAYVMKENTQTHEGDASYRTCVHFGYGKFTTVIASYGAISALKYTALIQNSSRDIKHNIQPLQSIGDRLDTLKPVTFVYDDDENEKQRMGLIYEDTVQNMPEICTDDESNKAINYVELIPALLKEIQDLRARVKALEEERGGN